MQKSKRSILISICMLLLIIAVAPSAAQDEKVITVGLGVGPGGDENGRPWTGGAGNTTHIKQFITPTIFNELGTEMIPYAAESWESNDDFTVWTYTLHDNLMWSDGTPLTANDWKFTADFVTASDFDTDQPGYLNQAFSDAEGFDARRAGDADELVGVQVIDDLTLEYTLSQPNPRHFINQFRTYILPQHAIDFEPSEYFTNDWFRDPERMVGSGPFVVSEYEPDAFLTLEKNTFYFEGEPKLDKIIIRYFGGDISAAVLALSAGEIDFTYLEPTDLEVIGDGYEVFSGNSTVVVFIDINYKNVPEFWQDIRVRQAILYAIDREAITSQVLQDTFTSIPCPVSFPELWADDLDWYEYNPEKAIELLAESGVDPADIEMEWVGHSGYDNILHNSALQAMQAYLAQIGINNTITYQFLDVATFRDTYTSDGPWTFRYRGLGYPIYGGNPANNWGSAGGQGGDFKGYDTQAAGLDGAIDAINTALTTEDYLQAMTDFCSLHNELLPDLQLWVGNRFGAASSRLVDFWWQPAGGGGPYYDHSHLWDISS